MVSSEKLTHQEMICATKCEILQGSKNQKVRMVILFFPVAALGKNMFWMINGNSEIIYVSFISKKLRKKNEILFY